MRKNVTGRIFGPLPLLSQEVRCRRVVPEPVLEASGSPATVEPCRSSTPFVKEWRDDADLKYAPKLCYSAEEEFVKSTA
jgi:hypothetical protein